MTLPLEIERKCAVCGTTGEYVTLFSSYSYGSPDLDLRPSEVYRSTMELWVQECPECGYVSGNISIPTSITKEWLQSEKYLTCDGIPFTSDLARRFYKCYLINLQENNLAGAFYAALHAAWACDDTKSKGSAKHCRKLAIPLVTKLIEENCKNNVDIDTMRSNLLQEMCESDELNGTSLHLDEKFVSGVLRHRIKEERESRDKLQIIRADLMRRAGLFDELIETYSSMQFEDELPNQIIKFQIEKAKEKDTSRYLRRDAAGGEW